MHSSQPEPLPATLWASGAAASRFYLPPLVRTKWLSQQLRKWGAHPRPRAAKACGCHEGEGLGEGRTGVWDEQMQSTIERMGERQGPAVEPRELYSSSRDQLVEKKKKKDTNTCITESVCCTAEINTTLYINYT